MSNDLNFIETDTQKIYDTIITELENGVAEPLYPGDERRIFGEAMVPLFVALYSSVNDACRQKLLRYARGPVLDAIGENRGLEREDAGAAKATLRFSLNEAINTNVTIPAGTRVTSDFERYFATDTTVVLVAGSTHVDVTATAMEGGVDYNDIPAGAINIVVDLLAYIDAVENLATTAGGSDVENDEAFRERIRAAVNKVTTAGPAASYRYWAMQADPTVADAIIESPEACEVVITPILYGGSIPDDQILAKVLASCSAPDVRPLTDKVTVKAPATSSYDINIIYYTTPENEADCVRAVEGSGGAIDQYIYWQGAALDRDINPDQLRKLILSPEGEMEGLPGADRVIITAPVYTELDKTTVAKFTGNLTVQHIVKEG